MIANIPVNILLVDNEPDHLALLQASLDQKGVTLVLGNSGQEALTHIQGMDFAVIVLDLHMPGISGFEVARSVRAHGRSKSTPIIFLTGADPRAFPIEQAYALGAVDYLVKPVSPTILRAKVAVFVELYRNIEALALTERARYMAALGMKNEQIRLILSNAKGYACVVTDQQGRITEWEGCSAAATGWAVKEMTGEPLAQIFTPENRTAHSLEDELMTAKMHGLAECKRWHLRKNGTRFFADAVLIALKDAGDQLYGFAYIFRDTTAERQTAEVVRAGEQKLQESRGLFSLVLQSTVDGIFGIKADTSCMFFNAPGAAMLGYEPEELKGLNLHQVIHHHHSDGSVYPMADCPINQAAQAGVPLRVEEEVFWHKNGTSVPVTYSVSPMVVNGTPSGAVITFSNITERKRHEAEREHLLKEVQAANDRLADVFQQAPAFMAVLRGPAHVFEMVNDRYLALVGNRYPIGLAVRQALPELAGQGFFKLLDTVFETGEPYVGFDMPIALQRQAAGPVEIRSVDFVYLALRDADSAVSGVLIHGVDQTDRKLAETALRASEERYRMLFESMDQGFCIVEMLPGESDEAPIDFRVLEINSMVYKHTGLIGSVGKTIRELAPDVESHWIEQFAKVAISNQSVRFEAFSKSLNRWFDVFAYPVGNPHGKRIALLFSDITVRKKSEKDLQQLAADLAEADRRKTEFLATLAHELRNPLAPIRAGLGLLCLETEPARVTQTLAMMDRQVNQMVHLIDDLLDMARITAGKLELKKERVDLHSIVSMAIETSQPHIQERQHELAVDMPDETLVLNADPTRIAQVISNLLNNAARYTPAGGRIDLSVHQDASEAVVSVADNGIGLAQEDLQAIFEMFSQVPQSTGQGKSGLGIGLSLVRQLVQMHGGTIVGTSSGMSQGSTFTVRLPLSPAQALPAPVEIRPVNMRLANKKQLRILVVDDHSDAAQALAALLAQKGDLTSVAYSGQKALEVATKFMPDVAFLDIGMPGMDGHETARAMRKIPGLEKMILIALTGWGTQADRTRSAKAGFDHHLTKPAALDAVDALLTQIAGHRQS